MKPNHILGHLLALVLMLGSSALAGESVLSARFPALSPDGATVAFCYMGDIWTVPSTGGEAKRITFHDADDIRPHFSPDGNTILFSSRRHNNYDVFLIPAEGGAVKQLTFGSSMDVGSGWFPDGDSVLFTSKNVGWRDIFKVSVNGGMPIMLTGYPYEQEFNARITPDKKFLIYNNGSGNSRWWRRDLKSSRNCEIFMQDRSKPEFTSIRLTNYANHDVWPALNTESNEIYFVSCRGDWGQVHRIPVSGGEAVQLTNFDGDGVTWLNSNPQGTVLVFEQGQKIWFFDPNEGEPREVPITVRSDERSNVVEARRLSHDVEWFSLSPDEKKIASIIYGEVFIIPSEEPKTAHRLTRTTARERFVVWGKDSRTVYYASDRNGNYDIYKADVTADSEVRLSESSDDETKPVVSPDGRYLAFYRGLDKVIIYDLEKNTEQAQIDGVFFDLGVEPSIEYDWSPDSKWLIFTAAGPTYETDIYVSDLSGDVHNISRFAGWNYSPRFSADGKFIYFSSEISDFTETYKIDLVRKPVEFEESAFDSLFAEDEKDEDDGKESKKLDSEKAEEVRIDFDLIERRRSKAYSVSAASRQPALTPDLKKYVFVSNLLGKPEIWTIDAEDGEGLKQLTRSGGYKSNLIVSGDSKSLFYLEAGRIKKCGIDGSDPETLAFDVWMEVDQVAMNKQKFNEAWALLNSFFYDSTFHGTDWEWVRQKYEPSVSHARTERDFRYIVLEMMGELRASHLDIYSRMSGPNDAEATCYLGVELDYAMIDKYEEFRIARVYPGGPADMVGLVEGDLIKAIDGVLLTRSLNLNELLAGKEGKRVEVLVESDNKTSILNLKPISRGEHFALVYKDWVEGRRKYVDSLSGGRLAYLHIESMSSKCLEIFKQELVSVAEDKDGLIVDVRNNFGGNIAVHLLGMLVKTPYILRNFRDFPVTSENKMRSKAHEKPLALLMNNYSASNSEIFAEGFRKLKLGKIIGEPTSGAVIGTSSYGLIDGMRMRRPSWGAYTTEMEDTDLYPRQPDIFIENLPDDFINDRDPQLKKAVEELMKELK